MSLLPLAEIVTRKFFHWGIPGSSVIVQHLTLVIAFLGAALAAREGRLLKLATGEALAHGRFQHVVKAFGAAVGACVSAALCYASYQLVITERGAGLEIIPGVKRWAVEAVMPFGLGLMALRQVWRASDRWPGRAIAALGIVAAVVFKYLPESAGSYLLWPLMILLIAGTAVGAPIFAMIGGAAMLLFWSQPTPVSAVAVEAYRLTISPMLPTIPLFTLAGYILAEGGTSKRLVRLFNAWFGWCPGGTAVVASLVCAFFTTFTGGSGVTILAVGGLLLPMMLQAKYSDRFSVGLLTTAGSLGLLFPPSLPVILYGIVAQQQHVNVDIKDLFIAGFLPGCLMVGACVAWSVRQGLKSKIPRSQFTWAEAWTALRDAKWEVALPIVVMVFIFGGFATLVEAAALTVLYAFFIECVIHRDLKIRRDLPRTVTECATLLGGVMIILCVALGLTSYLVDAEIPARMATWVRSHVESQFLFLLGLNIMLIFVGGLMDIFPAIVVVVPLITPMGAAFGVDPIHLGIIFLANMEFGFLAPPVGLNLLLASYRFGRPLTQVYRNALPGMFIMFACVLIITYVPAMTTGVLRLVGR
ncbi:MAG: TRAP transporter large permease subunit [Verrucomicrobia bacterium]|nr:TRAP transporter large permease subunit [Verrucomicrobiota bacterium]